MSDELGYDSLNIFRVLAKKDLAALGNRLESLNDKVNEIAGVSEFDPTSKEPAVVTTRLCAQLFHAMGVNVALDDIVSQLFPLLT